MDFRSLPIVFSLNLILMTANAALPPQIYWERMLPTTPMPKPIIELLKHGGFVSTEDVGKVTNEDQNAHIVEWGKSLDSQSDDKFPTTLYFSKKDLSQEKTRSENDFPFFANGAKKSEPTLKTHSENNIPFFFYGVKKSEPTQKTHSENNIPFFFYGVKKSEPTRKTHSENNIPFFFYGAKKSEPTQKIHSENNIPFFFYGAKKSEPTQKTHSENNIPFFFYGDKKGELAQKTLSPNNMVTHSIIDANSLVPKMSRGDEDMVTHSFIDANSLLPKMSRGDEDKITTAYQKAHNQLHNNANGLIPEMRPVHEDHQLHDHPKGNYFFMEESLRPGSKLDVHFNEREHKTPLLPRHVAQRIPFTSAKIKEILDIFSAEPGSQIAEDVGNTLWRCEAPPIDREEKHCATSLESMVDFITSMLGNNVLAMSTEVEREAKSRKFTVKEGVKKLADDNVIVCHPVKFPHMVFYCHHLLNTTAYFVPVEGEDGTRVKAVAVCHRDTSQWDPNAVGLQVLKLKPGDAPVCHVLPEGHLLFAK